MHVIVTNVFEELHNYENIALPILKPESLILGIKIIINTLFKQWNSLQCRRSRSFQANFDSGVGMGRGKSPSPLPLRSFCLAPFLLLNQN